MERKLAVIGYPIKHSLSPAIHNFWLKKYNINNVLYDKTEVKQEELKNFLDYAKNSNFIGMNLTMPLKEECLKYLDDIDINAKKINAVNTIKITNDKKLIGYNTDCYGFMEGLNNSSEKLNKNDKILIFGAGGASKACIQGLLNNGFKNIFLVNRTYKKAINLYDNFDKKINILHWEDRNKNLNSFKLLVNATSTSLKNELLDIEYEKIKANTICYDLVYNPKLTLFLQKSKESRASTINGLPMLLYQASLAFKIWFDILPNINELEKILKY